MSTNVWPMMLDFTRDESKRLLRRLELDAYAGVMTAFRAQGHLSAERKRILKELQSILSISTERHRAEVRRALNDERLYTIADNMGCGSNVTEKWIAEGRRLVPLLPRLVPQTAFTATANAAANAQADKNMTMLPPSKTGSRDREVIASTTAMQTATTATTASSSSMANFTVATGSMGSAGPSGHANISNTASASTGGDVVVLPNGMSIHIKGGLNSEDDLYPTRHHRRSSSTESLLLNRPSHPPAAPQLAAPSRSSHPHSVAAVAAVSNTIQGIAPLKISVTKSQTSAKTSGQQQPQQKVIIVSNASTWPTPHKSYVVAKSGAATATVATPSGGSGGSSLISSSSQQQQQRPASLLVGKTGTAHVTDTILSPSSYLTYSATKLKPSTVSAVQKGLPTSRGTMVIPVGSQSSTQSFQNIHIKPAVKPPIHIKQEGSMKIITQGLPTSLSTASKILPKPAGCPIVVVTTAPSASKPGKVANLVASTCSSAKMLNLSGAQRVVTSASLKQTSSANIVTVNPKKLHFATIKSAAGTTVLTSGSRLASSGLKPNVIVVQKSAGKKGGQLPATIQLLKTPTSSTVSSAFEKELVSFIQKQDSHHKQLVVPQRGVLKHMAEASKKPPVVRPAKPIDTMPANPTHVSSPSGRSSLLAELIHAAGIGPDGGTTTSSVGGMMEGTQASEVNQAVSDMVAETETMSADSTAADKDTQNMWVEYDMPTEEVVSDTAADHSVRVETTSGQTDHSGQLLDTAAIKALLEMANSSQGTPDNTKKQSRPVDLNQITAQLQSTQSQVYVVDESGQLVSGEDFDKLPANLTPDILQQYVQTIAASKTKPFHNVPNVVAVQVSTTSTSELDPQTGVLHAPSSISLPTPQCVSVALSTPGVSVALPTPGVSVALPVPEVSVALPTTEVSTISIPEVSVTPRASLSRVNAGDSVTLAAPGVTLPIHGVVTLPASSRVSAGVHQVIDEAAEMDHIQVNDSTHDAGFLSGVVGAEEEKEITVELVNPGHLSRSQSSLVSILVPPSSGGCMAATTAVPTNSAQEAAHIGAGDGCEVVNSTIADHQHLHQEPNYAHLQCVKQKLSFGQDATAVSVAQPSISVPSAISLASSLSSSSSSSSLIKSVLPGNVRQIPVMVSTCASHVLTHSATTTVTNMSPCPSSVVVLTTTSEPVFTVTQSLAPSVVVSVTDGCVTASEGRVTVAVQPQVLDTTHMQMEDFTSQRIYADSTTDMTTTTPAAHSSSDSLLADATVRLGKRKRKLSSPGDDASTAWIKSALVLLQKVAKYRGANKEKGMRNAAAWFTRPVSPKVVPDYYQIIQRPMDFSTVRKKLELRRYSSWEDFHEDMLLVQQNCHQYNPPGSEVRLDCDDVFAFYGEEYEKAKAGVHAVEQTVLTSSPSKLQKLNDQ